MKPLALLGDSSGSGKSWIATALCCWLRNQGVRVAPFKAQSVTNSYWATFDGGEIARAQVVQAEACGLAPVTAMNPILLKPSGEAGAQIIVNGRPRGHLAGINYNRAFDAHWSEVAAALDGWRERCDVLVMEGATGPARLGLRDPAPVDLRPIRHVDARWLLVEERDGGDIRLFSDPTGGSRDLGTVPFRASLDPDPANRLSRSDEDRGSGETIAWLHLPHVAILTECQPWWADEGVRTRWVSSAADLADARAIVIPGSKNTIADMRWLRRSGLADAVAAAARRGTLVVGICGGYQILGRNLSDPGGVAGDSGQEPGLGLLPVDTVFVDDKLVQQVTAECGGRAWTAFEMHMGRTRPYAPAEPVASVRDGAALRGEGSRVGNVWGTYLHGFFEAPEVRRRTAAAAGITGHRAHPVIWSEQRQAVYAEMARHLAVHVDLDPIRRYIGL